MNEVMEWFAGESLDSIAFGKEQCVTVDHSGAAGGEVSALFEAVEALFCSADRIDFGIERHHDLLDGIGGRDMRISAQVFLLQDVMPERATVLAAEPAAPIVAVSSELRGTGLRLD